MKMSLASLSSQIVESSILQSNFTKAIAATVSRRDGLNKLKNHGFLVILTHSACPALTLSSSSLVRWNSRIRVGLPGPSCIWRKRMCRRSGGETWRRSFMGSIWDLNIEPVHSSKLALHPLLQDSSILGWVLDVTFVFWNLGIRTLLRPLSPL